MSHLCAQMLGSDVQTKDKIYQKETSQCTLNIKLKYEQPLLGLHSFLVKFKYYHAIIQHFWKMNTRHQAREPVNGCDY